MYGSHYDVPGNLIIFKVIQQKKLIQSNLSGTRLQLKNIYLR